MIRSVERPEDLPRPTMGALVFGLAFSGTDLGPGLSEQWAGMVFDKFGQVEARKADASGTGLGLTFCRLAVETQGGRICLGSEAGAGTTITFTLPVRVAERDT